MDIGLTILGLGVGGGQVATMFLTKLLGPGLEAVGEGSAAPLVAWKEQRVKRAVALLEGAGQQALAAGGIIQPVPGRILFPILESGSLEDNPDLQKLWATLLATAANPHTADTVLSSFPHILSELSPIEAQILDFICAHGKEQSGYVAFNVTDVSGHFDVNHSTTYIYRDNLERLNVLARPLSLIGHEEAGAGSPYQGPLYLTSLGYAFVRACTGHGI